MKHGMCVFFSIVLNTQNHVYSLCGYNVFVTFNIYTSDRLGHFQKIEQQTNKKTNNMTVIVFFCLRSILLVIVCPFFVLLLPVRF